MQNDAKCVTILNHDGGRDKMIEHFEPDRQGMYRVPILTSSQKEYDNSLKLIEVKRNWTQTLNQRIPAPYWTQAFY